MNSSMLWVSSGTTRATSAVMSAATRRYAVAAARGRAAPRPFSGRACWYSRAKKLQGRWRMKAMTAPISRGWKAPSTPPSQRPTSSSFTMTATSTMA